MSGMKSGNKRKLFRKKQTNLNIAAICTVILQIKMNVNMAAELYHCNSYIQCELQIWTMDSVEVINNNGDKKVWL
jgi:hypothetical protein